MGNKIITEKDFWMCTGGAVPAPLQSRQLATKKKSGEKYITKIDTATSSVIDFGCTKLMFIMAILAAAITVVTVATGGAALIAIGALAGAAGAALGAVVGGLICGQVAAMARMWLGSKSNMIVSGQPAITGDHKMKCMLFGDEITFAPQIKNWWQAIALGGANYIGGIMEGMMAGAAIGMAGAAIGGLRTAFTQGGVRAMGQASLNFLKTMPRNFYVNALESVSVVGLGLRGVMGVQNMAATYGNTGTASTTDFLEGVVAMETGTIESVNNVATGQGTWQDYVGMAMMFAPVGQGKRDLESALRNEPDAPARDAENSRADDAEANRADEEGATQRTSNQEGETATQRDGEAYEAGRPFDANGNLKPNIEYESGEFGYRMETDSSGRLSRGSTDNLQFTERTGRLRHNSDTPGKLEGDHAGHLFGDRFGGSPELDNLVSQQGNRVNLSEYKRLENRWARAIDNGQTVTVDVRVNYEGGSTRPSSFDVNYTIDGEPFSQQITN